MPSGPIFMVPSQVTAHLSVGSTTGRHAPPSMAVSLPLAGSRKNDWAVISPVVLAATRLPMSRRSAHDAKTLAWSLVTT